MARSKAVMPVCGGDDGVVSAGASEPLTACLHCWPSQPRPPPQTRTHPGSPHTPPQARTRRRLWEEFTTKHDLVRPVEFQAHSFWQPLICSVGKPCVDCARKRRRTADA
eukprot:256124-Prymnesium_polylepis.1